MADLATKLNEKTDLKKADLHRHMLAKMRDEIVKALPNHIEPEHFSRVVLTAIKNNEDLLKCTPISIISSVMLAAQMGLEPNVAGACYLVPYGKECTFQIGYRGLIQLVRRSGDVSGIYAEPVYEDDEFEMMLGTDPKIHHKPNLAGDRQNIKKIKLFYAVCQFANGGHQFCFMTLTEIEAHRDRYSKMTGGPWKKEFIEMAKKTVVIRLTKMLPLSIEIQRQVAQDAKVKSSLVDDMTLIQEDEDQAFDVDAEDVTDAEKEKDWHKNMPVE